MENKLLDIAGKGLVKLSSWVLGTIATGFAISIVNLEAVLTLAAMVGGILIIMGNKKWGTRLTSWSILLYIVGRVILK